MSKKYEKPELEVDEFEVEDVITASAVDDGEEFIPDSVETVIEF